MEFNFNSCWTFNTKPQPQRELKNIPKAETWPVHSCSQRHVAWCAGDSWFQLTVPLAGNPEALQKHTEALRPVAGKSSPASHALFSSNLKFVQVTKHCPRVQTTRVTSPSREEWQRMNAKLFHRRPLTPTVAQASLSRPLFLFSRNY